MPTSRPPGPRHRAVALLTTLAVCAALALAGLPTVAAQSDGGSAAVGDTRCFPPGGHDLGIGSGDPHINVTVHTSLFTSPAPPSALGLSARGVALDSDIVVLRTGVLFEGDQENVSAGSVWERFVVLFDYRFSLPMFADSIGESTYEPTDGPVSGVETRAC